MQSTHTLTYICKYNGKQIKEKKETKLWEKHVKRKEKYEQVKLYKMVKKKHKNKFYVLFI